MSDEIKVGDKVRVREDAPKIFLLGWYGFIGNVVDIEDSYTKIECNDCTLVIPTKYLVKVDAEAKEAKYKKGDRVKFKNIYELQKVKDKSFRWMLVMFASKEATVTAVEDNGFYRVDIDPSVGGINDDMIERKVEQAEARYTKTKGDTLTFPIAFDLTDSYWDAYAADLAKEIAVKIAIPAFDAKDTANYAVSVAKLVVENLKKSAE